MKTKGRRVSENIDVIEPKKPKHYDKNDATLEAKFDQIATAIENAFLADEIQRKPNLFDNKTPVAFQKKKKDKSSFDDPFIEEEHGGDFVSEFPRGPKKMPPVFNDKQMWTEKDYDKKVESARKFKNIQESYPPQKLQPLPGMEKMAKKQLK